MNTEKYFSECIRSIADIVRYDSSQAPALPDMPFGKGAADALNFFLKLAESMGFETHNYDNYAGEVIFGEGEEFAILCHLDVVPAGSGWSHDPFGGEICEGKLFGRGTMDDKGPAVICLYCLKALKDDGFVPKKKIKLIVGCNEENGWECIAHYNRAAHMPKIGFSPDADFPAIWAEKGILQLLLRFPLKKPPFCKLYGGERPNMVCERATAEGAKVDAALAEKCGVSHTENAITAVGKSAHASTPEKGDNALRKLLGYFARQSEEIADVYEILFEDGLKIKDLKDETGPLTFSPNVADFENSTLCVTADVRYPATFKREEIEEKFRRAGVSFEALHCQEPLYNDKNSFLISTLCKVYEEQTGLDGTPIAIGGGTYARALECGAGFGPQFPNEPSTIHQKDEYISLENAEKLLRIYYHAIRELTK